MKHGEYYFFWDGPFSNWHPASFEYQGHRFANSEQAFMWRKAKYFNDHVIADKMLRETDPSKVKALGRKVTFYDDKAWSEVRYDIMVDVNLAKFSQNLELRDFLIAHSHLEIVEASPVDTIWGIGLTESAARKVTKDEWQGLNLLGIAMNEVADLLKTPVA